MPPMLDFATRLAVENDMKNAEFQEQLEAARECCRTIVSVCGLTFSTHCFAMLWLGLTTAQCKFNENPCYNIDLSSIAPGYDMNIGYEVQPLEHLQSLNPYHMVSFRAQLQIMRLDVLPSIKHLAIDFITEVQEATDEVSAIVVTDS